jgi:hypothetical protein
MALDHHRPEAPEGLAQAGGAPHDRSRRGRRPTITEAAGSPRSPSDRTCRASPSRASRSSAARRRSPFSGARPPKPGSRAVVRRHRARSGPAIPDRRSSANSRAPRSATLSWARPGTAGADQTEARQRRATERGSQNSRAAVPIWPRGHCLSDGDRQIHSDYPLAGIFARRT